MTNALAQGGIWTNVFTTGLKLATSRERPDQEDDLSFPSGHTANMFNIAVIAGHYYGKKVEIPLYIFAAFVGWSRVDENAHYLSDVVAGAGLGYLVGKAVIRANQPRNESQRLTWVPILGRKTIGVRFSLLL